MIFLGVINCVCDTIVLTVYHSVVEIEIFTQAQKYRKRHFPASHISRAFSKKRSSFVFCIHSFSVDALPAS